ncbi:hypothetical protein Fmac_019108 [Flemingia macrophylla]|uniref:Major facilitator superfamily (MFS) profile domain-containing protein n=1 Tax=Flemingia macrophylla TaxID=520843 RepID=A0ABD1M6U7_9FABA
MASADEMCTESSDPERKKICMEEMLRDHCGEFGRWQLKHFVLTSLAWVLVAFHTMVMIFADHQPHSTSHNICQLKPTSWEWLGGRAATTVSQWALICAQKYKVGLARALFFLGSIIGGGVFGHLADSFLGRKRTLGVACTLNAIFGCLTALSPNYWIYVLLRIFTGFTNTGVALSAYVLASEPIGLNKRGTVGMCTFYFFSGGIALLSGIAYIFQTWRYLYVASSIPSFLYIILVLPFLSESPRWYLVRGRVTEAMKLMSTIASSNGRVLPDGVILALDQDQSSNTEGLENKGAHSASIVDVIRNPTTRVRLFTAMALNFLCDLVYYGLSLNVMNLKSNLYVNVLINAVGEMPAFFVTAVLMERFGRKPLTVGTMWFSAVFCLMGSMVGNVGVWKVVRMVSGVLGIFGMAGTYNLLFIYTAELFPTVVRNAALGCTTQASQMGAILAPFVVVLGGRLPFEVFAACGIVGGIFAFYLPETLNQPLYDTFDGMEAELA